MWHAQKSLKKKKKRKERKRKKSLKYKPGTQVRSEFPVVPHPGKEGSIQQCINSTDVTIGQI